MSAIILDKDFIIEVSCVVCGSKKLMIAHLQAAATGLWNTSTNRPTKGCRRIPTPPLQWHVAIRGGAVYARSIEVVTNRCHIIDMVRSVHARRLLGRCDSGNSEHDCHEETKVCHLYCSFTWQLLLYSLIW